MAVLDESSNEHGLSPAQLDAASASSLHGDEDLDEIDLAGWDALDQPMPEPMRGSVHRGETGGEPNVAFSWYVPDDVHSPLTVLPIHGAGHAGWCCAWVTHYLVNRGASIVVLDLPGHGRSSGWEQEGQRPEKPVYTQPVADQAAAVRGYTLHDYASAVGRVMEAMHLDSRRTVVLGHSMGGTVAQLVASQLSTAEKPLAGLVSLGMSSWNQIPGEVGTLFSRDPLAFLGSMVFPKRPISRRFIRSFFFSGQSSSQEIAWMSAHMQLEASAFFKALGDGKTVYKEHLSGGLLGVPPVLFMRGQDDNISTAKGYEGSLTDFANATRTTLDGLPHDAMLPNPRYPDAPATVAEGIWSFVLGPALNHSEQLCAGPSPVQVSSSAEA